MKSVIWAPPAEVVDAMCEVLIMRFGFLRLSRDNIVKVGKGFGKNSFRRKLLRFKDCLEVS